MELSPRDILRFWSKVDKFGPTQPHMNTPCWVWTGGLRSKPDKYGAFIVAGKVERTHRIAFFLGGGVLTEAAPCVLHHCDNERCVRFDHLFAGTRTQNNDDKMRKGRQARGIVMSRAIKSAWARGLHARGEKCPKAKLTSDAVLAIRRSVGRTDQELARDFGVSRITINRIRGGRAWTHVHEDGCVT